MTLTAATPDRSPVSIATNAIPAIDHAPVAAAFETTEIPAVAADDDAAGLGVTPFAGLLPNAARAAQPPANDDVAPMDQVVRKPNSPRVKNAVFEGRAEMQLRRVVSRRLVAARDACGFGQQEAARAIGYETPGQLSQWESGRRFPPTSELIKLSKLYHCSLDFLLGEAPEMDRDPAAGLRHSMLRGVRFTLSRCAEVVTGEINRHARLVGTDAGSTGQFIAAGTDLLDAVRSLERLNPGRVDDMRGGATLARRLHEFESALLDAKRRQRLSQALDADLRERLGRLPDGDIDIDGETLIGDDEA